MGVLDVLLVLWFAGGVIASVVMALVARAKATPKRRRPWLWFALGLLFGIFALFALARLPVVPPQDEAVRARNVTRANHGQLVR